MKGQRSLDRNRLGLIGIVLGAVLFLSINTFSNITFRSAQLDLTERELFTLSDATRQVLGSLEEPITLRLFFTRELGDAFPDQAAYHTRVREFLERYASLAAGKIRLEFHNPAPFSEIEDRAVTFGLRGVPYNNTGDHGYFGLSGNNSIDGQETIPFFARERERFLEYDLTKLVHSLTTVEQPTVGLVSSLPIQGGYQPGQRPVPAWAIVDQIREFFDVNPLPRQFDVVPEDVDVLMLVHPREFSPQTLYAIDQYALAGGTVMVFLDPNAELQPLARGQLPAASDLGPLLDAWGVSLADGKVATDIVTGRRVNVRHQGQIAVSKYIAWNTLTPENMATDDTVIGDITSVNVGSAGLLTPTEGATTTFTPLLQTTEQSQALDVASVQGQIDVIKLFREFQSGNTPLTLAARVTGPIKTAFPDGRPAPLGADADQTAAANETFGEQIIESQLPLNAIVVADTDLLHEGLWADVNQAYGERLVVPYAGNADFVINGLEALSGGAALAGLRSRRDSQRPFDLVEDIRLAAEQQFRDKQQELLAKLERTQADLLQLTNREQTTGEAVLTPQEKDAIDGFRREMVLIRKDLRGVQHELRKDIDALDTTLTFLNIAAIPLLLCLLALVLTLVRRAKRRGPVAAG